MKVTIFIMICSLFYLSSCGLEEKENKYNLIPYPQSLEKKIGNFEMTQNTKIHYYGNEEGFFVANSFCKLIQSSTGFDLHPINQNSIKKQDHTILFLLDASKQLNKGQYMVDINCKNITITASNAIGLFYGMQTIRQLLPPEIESKKLISDIDWTIPCAYINDQPLFEYRGLMLDVGRHFFPVEFIKKYIDLLALHKMNKFHWHLTEDQGWRIEIKKYPKLNQISAFRNETLIGHGGKQPFKYDGKPYGGYYTQEEIRDIVKYAEKQFITIIPEIELPGHALAALAAYPKLGCTGGPYEVAKRWGVFDEVFCAGNEKTFQFLEDVLLEVMDLFPSEYIHIGGDECPKTKWKDCVNCQKRMKDLNIEDPHELQSYFIKRIEKFINAHGRNIIGWDEILEGGLAPNATVMSWRGIKGGVEAARLNHDVIMTPYSHFYLDYYQNDSKNDPLAIGSYIPIKKVYSFNPYPKQLCVNELHYIKGVQGNVWTEYMPNAEHVEMMVYPRACAIAEIGWLKPRNKDYNRFKIILKNHLKRFDYLNVNYYKSMIKPKIIAQKDSNEMIESITIENNGLHEKIYYTLDGTMPNVNSEVYTKPILISNSTKIRAIIISEDGQESEMAQMNIDI